MLFRSCSRASPGVLKRVEEPERDHVGHRFFVFRLFFRDGLVRGFLRRLELRRVHGRSRGSGPCGHLAVPLGGLVLLVLLALSDLGRAGVCAGQQGGDGLGEFFLGGLGQLVADVVPGQVSEGDRGPVQVFPGRLDPSAVSGVVAYPDSGDVVGIAVDFPKTSDRKSVV